LFSDLLDFAHRRSPLQALGWYLAFTGTGLLLAVAAAFVAATAEGAATPEEGFAAAVPVVQMLSVTYVALLGLLTIRQREKDFPNLTLLFGAIAIGLVFGMLGGLVPVAYMTTRPALST
jgi:uncharacterized membrane protein